MKNLMKSVFILILVVIMIGYTSTWAQEGAEKDDNDTFITSKIKNAFAAEPTVSVLDIKVETFKGVVQLIWVHDMEAHVKNVATREKLAQDRPTAVKITAVIQKSGNMRFFINTNPWEKGLNLSGEAELKGFALTDFNDFLTPKTDLQAVKGTFDLFVSFKVEKNKITGGIKPMLQNVDVAPEKSSLIDWLKSKVVDETILLLSGPPEAPEEKQKIATIIPIKGTITNPDPQILPTVLGIIRNAFVEGLSAAFANLPPPTAPKKEGVIKQIIDAVNPAKGPPEAQPKNGEK